MSKISITVETEDPAALKAVSNMLRDLMGGSDVQIPAVAAAPAPLALKAVPQTPADDGVDNTYDVDGRSYTADTIRSAGFTIEHLKRAGLLVAEIVDILGVTAELVDATSVPDISDLSEAGTDAEAGADEKPVTEVDSKGMPWDPRIHAGTKTKLNDGSWKIKRGVDKEVVELVEAELINLMEIPATATAAVVPTPPATAAVVPTPPATAAVVPAPPATAAVVPAPPATAAVVPAPPATATATADDDDVMTFAKFLKAVSAKMTAGETDMARILEVVNGKGIASLQLVNNRQDLIPELWALISTHERVAQ